jgi:hypothetical protein
MAAATIAIEKDILLHLAPVNFTQTGQPSLGGKITIHFVQCIYKNLLYVELIITISTSIVPSKTSGNHKNCSGVWYHQELLMGIREQPWLPYIQGVLSGTPCLYKLSPKINNGCFSQSSGMIFRTASATGCLPFVKISPSPIHTMRQGNLNTGRESKKVIY